MTRKAAATAKKAAAFKATREVEVRIEGYLAARSAQTRGQDKPACPYGGAEGAAWESGWKTGSWVW